MIKEAVTRGYIVGFTELGNTDDFSTEMLAWRLGHVSDQLLIVMLLTLFFFFLVLVFLTCCSPGRGYKLQGRPADPTRRGREEEEDNLCGQEDEDEEGPGGA